MGNIDRIVSLAKAQGISLASLCKRIGKTRTYLSEIYTRKRSVPSEYVQELAVALHTTPAYLIGETDDPYEDKKNKPILLDELAPEDRVLIERIRAASPEKKAAILALLKDH